jgi:hypothetical protein
MARRKNKSHRNKIADDERPVPDPGVVQPQIDPDELQWMSDRSPGELGLSDDWTDYGWIGGKDAGSFSLDEYIRKDFAPSLALQIILEAIVDGHPVRVIPPSKVPKQKTETQVRVEQAKRLLTGQKVGAGPPAKEDTDWETLKTVARQYFQSWLDFGEVSEISLSAVIENVLLGGVDIDHASREDSIRRTRDAFNEHKAQLLIEVTYPQEWLGRGQMAKIRQVLKLMNELGIKIEFPKAD